jgi:hypothetical protein
MDGVLLKIDLKLPMIKLNDHSFNKLCFKGFPPQWCEWMAKFVKCGNVYIKVNDDIEHYFQH